MPVEKHNGAGFVVLDHLCRWRVSSLRMLYLSAGLPYGSRSVTFAKLIEDGYAARINIQNQRYYCSTAKGRRFMMTRYGFRYPRNIQFKSPPTRTLEHDLLTQYIALILADKRKLHLVLDRVFSPNMINLSFNYKPDAIVNNEDASIIVETELHAKSKSRIYRKLVYSYRTLLEVPNARVDYYFRSIESRNLYLTYFKEEEWLIYAHDKHRNLEIVDRFSPRNSFRKRFNFIYLDDFDNLNQAERQRIL